VKRFDGPEATENIILPFVPGATAEAPAVFISGTIFAHDRTTAIKILVTLVFIAGKLFMTASLWFIWTLP
jgi:hypothetical protein